MSEISFSRYTGLLLRHGLDLIKREIVINGVITDRLFKSLDKQLKILENQDTPLRILLCTPGGSVTSGMAIVDRLTNSPCEITVIATGRVMSMGIPILAAGDVRKATRFAEFMHHGASVDFPYGTLPIQENDLKSVKTQETTINKYLAEVTKKPYSFWASTGKHMNHYFDSDKALEYGLIDEIL